MPQIIAVLRKCRTKGGLQKQKPMQGPRYALCPFALVVSLSLRPPFFLSLSVARPLSRCRCVVSGFGDRRAAAIKNAWKAQVNFLSTLSLQLKVTQKKEEDEKKYHKKYHAIFMCTICPRRIYATVPIDFIWAPYNIVRYTLG